MLERGQLIELLRRMYRIRFFEERLCGLYDYTSYLRKGDTAADDYDFQTKGVVAGAIHLAIGQEATEVGVGAALGPDDYVTGSHRGHGHALAKGAAMRPMMAELMGRRTGYSRGCGGSMHLFCADLGLLGGNGIVGAQIPLATGAAFSAKYRRTKQVAVAFFSEGASNQGTFHESLNLASLWKLPVIYVCENNLYAATTPAALALSVPDIADRAAGYGMPGVIVDGQDLLAVHDQAAAAVERARAGQGPTLIEAKTYRFMGHCGASGNHNNPVERDRWLQRDPISQFEGWLVSAGKMTGAEQAAMQSDVRAEVEDAVAYGKQSPFPTLADMPLTPGDEL